MKADDDLDYQDGEIKVRLGSSWDLPLVAQIDALAPYSFTEEHWNQVLCQPGYAIYVAEVLRRDSHPVGVHVPASNDLAGFAVVNLMPDRVCILRLAVLPYYRRSGIGLALLQKVEERMRGARKFMRVMVPDTCLEMQLLLKAAQYECQEIYRSPVNTPDRYLFVKRRSKVRYANSFIVYSSEGKVVRDVSTSKV